MKTLTQIREQINPALQKIEKSRIEKKAAIKSAKIFFIIPIAIIIISLITFISNNPFWGIGGIAISFILFLIIYFIKIAPLEKEFKEEFKLQILPTFVQAVFSNTQFNHNNHISEAIFKDSNLFGRFNRYKGEDFFSGTTENSSPFQFSELTVQKVTSNGESTTTTTIFNGLFFKLELAQKITDNKVYVMPDSAEKNFGLFGKFLQKNIGSWIKGSKMIYMKEHPDFEKEYVVYAKNEAEGRRVLTPSLIGSLYNLRFKWKTPLYLAIDGNDIYIAIPDKKDNFEATIEQSVLDNAYIKTLYNKLSMCFTLIEDFSAFEFDLKGNTPNWQNNAYKHFNDANNPFLN